MAMLPPDPMYIFKGEMAPVSCVAYHITPYFEYLYAGTQTGKIHVWNLKTNREIDKFESGNEGCLSVTLSQEDNNNTVIAQDKAGAIRFWMKQSGKWTCAKEILTDYFGFCKSFHHEDYLFVPLKNSKIQSISTKTLEVNEAFQVSNRDDCGEIMAFKIVSIASVNFILVANESGYLSWWNFNNREKISDIFLEDCPMAIDFDTSTMKGICGNPTEKVIIFNFDRNFTFHILRTIKLINPGVASVSIRPDSRIVALGCWDGKLRLYSWKNLGILAVLDTHTGTIQDISFAHSSRDLHRPKYLLAAASKDCRISLWDLYN